MYNAYAVLMNEDNYGAIASEKPGFDLGEARRWVENYGVSWFIRDESDKRMDCRYLPDAIFNDIYAFETFEPNAIFHRVIRIKNGKA